MWEERLAHYDKLVALNPKFERKGKTVPYTSANTHMFSLLNKEGELGFRLSKEAGEAFMDKYNASRFKSHGSFMQGYVRVPDDMLDDMELLSHYLNEAYEYVMSLKPNPRKK